MDTNIEIIFGALTLVNIGFTTYIALTRSRSQNLVDDSTAATTYQKMVVSLQAQVDNLTEKLEGTHLYMGITMEIGKAPVITDWRWMTKDDTKPALAKG